LPHIQINRKLERFLTTPKPIKVAIGGRGSGKSIGFGDIFTMKMATEGADIYCLREFQESLSDSVHRVFKESIEERLCLDGWDVQENKVRAPSGAVTVYKGAARNTNNIQSAQGYKYSWFEEAHTASKESLDKLLPTILRNPGAECWFSANPQSSADAFSQRFIVPYQTQLDRDGFYEDELHLIIVVNHTDNPWWNEEQEALRRWDYENKPRTEYDWIWEGKFNDSVENALIKPEWFDACVDAHLLPKLAKMMRPVGPRVVAHDPFDDGNDAGGYALRHGSIIEFVRSKSSGEIDETLDWAVDHAIDDAADWFVWDGDGMGTGLKRHVQLSFDGTKIKYHMFRGSVSGMGQDNADSVYMRNESRESNEALSSAKTYRETFKNNRAQYYTMLKDRMYATYRCVVRGEYVDPDEMLSLNSDGIENIVSLRAQLCRLPVKPNGNGLIQLWDKATMKDRFKIASPNEADSIMMCMYSPTETVDPEAGYGNGGGQGGWLGS
jgi:phage terminase large subunit